MICIHYIRCHQPFQDNFPYRSYCLPEHLVLMEIFFSGSQSAPDMSFRLVDIQHLSCLFRQRRIHLHQPLRHVLMYCSYDLELFVRLMMILSHRFDLLSIRIPLILNLPAGEGRYLHFRPDLSRSF